MKQLVLVDPETYKPKRVLCTFKLDGDTVAVEPKEVLERRPYIAELSYGGKLLKPSDGAAYYDVLERALHGTYFYVEEIPDEPADA